MIKFTLTSRWVGCNVCQVMPEEELGYTLDEWHNLPTEVQEKRLEEWQEEQAGDSFWEDLEDEEVDDCPTSC